jgi:hypothetical protein
MFGTTICAFVRTLIMGQFASDRCGVFGSTEQPIRPLLFPPQQELQQHPQQSEAIGLNQERIGINTFL